MATLVTLFGLVAVLIRVPGAPLSQLSETSLTTTSPSSETIHGTDAGVNSFFTVENSYGGPVTSVKAGFFGDWMVVEPHRTTILTLKSGGSASSWSWVIERGSVDGPPGSKVSSSTTTSSPSLEYTFTDAGRPYTVSSTFQSVDGLTTHTINVICKYVRREMRQLNHEDAEAYMQAVKIMYTTELEEGRALYGENFKSAHWFTRWHLGSNSNNSPIHSAPSFFTGHAYLAMQFERSLQSINPSVAAHYYDVWNDFDDEWSSSFFWDSNWFGPLNEALESSGGNEHRVHGRFHNVTIMRNRTMSSSHNMFGLNQSTNSYGLITEPYNNNPSTYLERSPQICGVPTTKTKLQGCHVLRSNLNDTNMKSLNGDIQALHDAIHRTLGGLWECEVDFSNDAYASFIDVLMEAGLSASNIMCENYYESKFLTCPSFCAADTDFKDCQCTDKELLKELEKGPMNDSTTYNYFVSRVLTYNGLTFKFESMLTPSLDDDLSTADYRFVNYTESESYEIMRVILKLLSKAPKMSQFSSPLASPNDPIFWPIHISYEKIWHFLRLRPSPTFNSSWAGEVDKDDEASERIYGWGFDDTVLDFNDVYGIKRLPLGTVYTNREMVDLFDPLRPEMPYIFDDFGYAACQ